MLSPNIILISANTDGFFKISFIFIFVSVDS
jgi:hypothetical protein